MINKELGFISHGVALSAAEALELLNKGTIILYRDFPQDIIGKPIPNTFFREGQKWWTYVDREGNHKIMKLPIEEGQTVDLYEKHILYSKILEDTGEYLRTYLYGHMFSKGYLEIDKKTLSENGLVFNSAFSDRPYSNFGKADVGKIEVAMKDARAVWAITLENASEFSKKEIEHE